jgi:hypothetical protein
MRIVAVPPPLASASAVFFGRRGDVTREAHRRGVPRQTLYREAAAAAEAVEGTPARLARDALAREVARLRARAADLERQRQAEQAWAAVIDPDKQAEFAAAAQAQGVSLTVAWGLLRLLLGGRTPSRAELGRRTRDAGRRAGQLLAVLDEASRPRARQVAADELFSGRRPVLVTVEQDSLCWLSGRLAEGRDGDEWAREFRQLPNAEQVTRDAAQGMEKGLRQVNAERGRDGRGAITDQEDHFHVLHRGLRALRQVRQKAVKALKRAEEAQRPLDQKARRGERQPRSQVAAAAWRWREAERAFDRWAAQEGAWRRLRAALRLFTPEGELNTRARAEAAIAEALAVLTGPEWVRFRRLRVRPQALAFLDRAQQRLAGLGLPAGVGELLAQAEGLRRRPEALRGAGRGAAALRGVLVLAGVVVAALGQGGPGAVRAVGQIVAEAWRASSLVEGLNSVLRMQQARHRKLSQELLDLKRLHWNSHVSRAGPRKGTSPYGRLGLLLPDGDWWQLLKRTPEQLRQQLSELNRVA